MTTLAEGRRRWRKEAAAVPGRRRRTRLFLHELNGVSRVAGPIVASQLGGMAMNTTDTLMVGPLGAESLAAAGLGSAIHIATLIVCTGTLLGMSPLVSQAYGAGNRAGCRRVAVQGLWLAAILAIPMTLVTLAGEGIMVALSQPEGVTALAGGYMRALAAGVLPLMLYMALRQYLEGMGNTLPAMVITFAGVGVNAVANLAFIYGIGGIVPAMGVVGAGWSTTIVRWCMFAAMLAFVLGRRRLRPFTGVPLRPEREVIGHVALIGLPIGAQLGAEIGIFAFAAVMMGWLGPLEQAAHQVAMNIAATTFMVALGTALAGGIRVGQHVGAGRIRSMRRATGATYLLVVGVMSVTALGFVAFPEWLVGLYTRDPAILHIGVALLAMAAAFQVFDGAQAAGLCALRGAADTRTPMLITLFGYWGVGAPVAYYLGFHTPLGAVGIWAGLVVALGTVSLLLGWRVHRVLVRGAPVRAAAG
jgi:multidrug resistance protein, MATE family